MKQPCFDCPFRKSVEYPLSPEKVQGIVQAIMHNKAFHCHETVDDSEFHEGRFTAGQSAGDKVSLNKQVGVQNQCYLA